MTRERALLTVMVRAALGIRRASIAPVVVEVLLGERTIKSGAMRTGMRAKSGMHRTAHKCAAVVRAAIDGGDLPSEEAEAVRGLIAGRRGVGRRGS